jgi:hypothetical protein
MSGCADDQSADREVTVDYQVAVVNMQVGYVPCVQDPPAETDLRNDQRAPIPAPVLQRFLAETIYL